MKVLCLMPSTLYHLKYIFISFICLAVSGLSCSTWNLGSSLQHAGSFTVAYELLVAAHGILFPDQGWNLGPLC